MANQPRIDVTSIHKTKWAWAVGTVVGVGRLGPGPGTYGSITAVLLWFGAIHWLHPGLTTQAIGTLIAALLALAIGVPAAAIVARESGREDPGHVVIDEVAGQLFALIAIPADWKHAVLALVLFRILDITKPWPIGRLESLEGGWGIMLDDVAAGLGSLALGFLLPLAFIAARFWGAH